MTDANAKDNLLGSGLMVLAMVGFALSDMFIKLVTGHLPVGQVVFLLGIGGFVTFAFLAWRRGETLLDRRLICPALAWRSLGEIIGTIGFITALTRIPLANASAIIQAMPLVVTLGAAVFFGAPVGWRRWAAIMTGMTGVLLIIRPGLAGFDINALYAVLAIAGLALRDLATRAVPKTISSVQISALGFGILIPTGGLLGLLGGAPVIPTATETWQLGLGIIIGLAGYYAITAAMRLGDVAVVTPYRYSRLLFALAIGMAVFGEIPDGLTLLGAGIIILSGLYSFLRERKRPLPLS